MGDDDDTKPAIPSKVTPTPSEWLRSLEHHPNGFRDLLAIHNGDIVAAAYQLARTRIVARGEPSAPPTARELYGAALEIHARAREVGVVPTRDALVADALRAGLDIAHR